MALVNHIEPITLSVEAPHTAVDCTFAIIRDREGQKYLQLDTYGSAERKLTGKKSQSLRLSPEAVRELASIIAANYPEVIGRPNEAPDDRGIRRRTD